MQVQQANGDDWSREDYLRYDPDWFHCYPRIEPDFWDNYPHLGQQIFDKLKLQEIASLRLVSSTFCQAIERQKKFWVDTNFQILDKHGDTASIKTLWEQSLACFPTKIAIKVTKCHLHFANQASEIRKGVTPLHICAKYNILEPFQQLLAEKCPKLNLIYKDTKMPLDALLCSPIHDSTLYNNYEVTKCLFDHGIVVESPDSSGYTPMHYLVHHNQLNLTKMLAKIVKDPNPKNKKNWVTPLHHAAEQKDIAMTQYLLMLLEGKNPADVQGMTPLHYLAKHGLVELCLIILNDPNTLDFNPGNLDWKTPLHFAAEKGHLPICELIMDKVHRRSKNPPDIHGVTPLHVAAGRGHMELLTFMISQLQDLSPTTFNYLETPLHHALCESHYEAAYLLHEAMNYTNPQDNFGCSILHLAAGLGLDKMCTNILSVEMKCPQNDEGKTPLHFAVEYLGTCEVLKTLLENGMENSIISRDCNGKTFLHHLVELNKCDLLEIALEYVRDKNPPDGVTQQTPLHYAAEDGNYEICQLFLNKLAAADLNPPDTYGRSPLHLAAVRGHEKVCGLFLDHVKDKYPLDVNGKDPYDLAKHNGHINLCSIFNQKGNYFGYETKFEK